MNTIVLSVVPTPDQHERPFSTLGRWEQLRTIEQAISTSSSGLIPTRVVQMLRELNLEKHPAQIACKMLVAALGGLEKLSRDDILDMIGIIDDLERR